MVDFRVTDGKSPVLFTTDGYQLVVMPMLTNESQKPKGETQTTEPAEVEASQSAESEAEKAEAVAEAEAITKAEKSRRKSGKRSKTKEPVAVA